jgi:sugar phosphate isomerase/epimerase
LLELLSPLRAAALATPEELLALVRALDAPDTVGTVVDLGHLADAGLDPARVLERWDAPLDALQLRGAASTPPPEDLPLRALLARAPALPRVVSVEHRTPTTPEAVERLVAHLRRELARTDDS